MRRIFGTHDNAGVVVNGRHGVAVCRVSLEMFEPAHYYVVRGLKRNEMERKTLQYARYGKTAEHVRAIISYDTLLFFKT